MIKRLKAGEEPFVAPPTRPDSVGDVIETYFKRHAEPRGLRTVDEKRRLLEQHVLPRWRDRPFVEVGRSDIARLCDVVEDDHGAWVADSVLIQLSAIARWYAGRHDSAGSFVQRGLLVDKGSEVAGALRGKNIWVAGGEELGRA